MDQNCTIQLQLKACYLPYLVAILLLLQLIVPYKAWLILLVSLGGAWVLGYLWVRTLARGLKVMCQMQYGWAQVGDKPQERFNLANKARTGESQHMTRTLYSAHRPDETDKQDAAHTWSQVRRRLWLARLLTLTTW